MGGVSDATRRRVGAFFRMWPNSRGPVTAPSLHQLGGQEDAPGGSGRCGGTAGGVPRESQAGGSRTTLWDMVRNRVHARVPGGRVNRILVRRCMLREHTR